MLHNGDCIAYMKTMDPESIDLIVTDPPYLMDYQSMWRSETPTFDKIAGDIDGHQLIKDYFEQCNRILKNDTNIYSFCSWHHIDFFKVEFEKHFQLKNILLWHKRGGNGLGDLDGSWAVDYEFILFGAKGRRILNKKIAKTRTSSVIKTNRVVTATMVHPTEKPVELIEQLVLASSDRGQVVFDGFVGSGSHGSAAVRNGRSFIGCELEERYYKIAKERIESASCTLDQFFV
jgi:site-specific DNA-methyltransferase (adenine-specific)